MVLCMGNAEEQQPSMEPAEFDPTFHGPIHDRGCTDVVCTALFLAVLFFHVVLGFVAWGNGNPKLILYPKNSTGHFCGIDENADKPYVYYYDPMKCATPTNLAESALDGFPCPTTQVCVKKCPRTVWVFNPVDFMKKPNGEKTFKQVLQNGEGSEVPCVESKNVDETIPSAIPEKLGDVLKAYIDAEECPYFHIKTLPMMGRCVPDIGTDLDPSETKKLDEGLKIDDLGDDVLGDGATILQESKNTAYDMKHVFNARGFSTKIFEDFAVAWGWIVLGLFTAMVFSLIFLLLLRYTAGPIVWGTLAGIVILLATLAFFSFETYEYLKKDKTAKRMDESMTDLEEYLMVPETWLAFFIILVLLDVIVLVVIVFLRERLRIAIAIIQEASKAVGYMKLTLAYPVVTFVLVVLCVGFWGVVSLYLVTFGDPEYHVKLLNATSETIEKREMCIGRYNITQTCDPISFEEDKECKTARCILKDYKAGFVKKHIEWMHAYNLFSSLWAVNFVIALGQCTLAGAFASYYWAFCKPGDIPKWPLLAAFTRTLRFHVGSLAFGSLIITLLQIVRMILEYVDHKTKDAQNPAIKFFTKCLKCLFWCLEKFLKFLNRNAYIMIAVYGNNFCLSAKNAFFLLLRNVVRVVVLDKVTDLLVFFGKLIVVGTVSGLFYCVFSGVLAEHGITAFQPGDLHYHWMPIITVSVGSYVIASGFFSVYTMCVDTLFLCFLEDLERNDGSQQKPYYMSSNLMKILDKSNQPRKKG